MLLFCLLFFFILHGSASYKLISVWISYFFYDNTTFTGQVLAGMIPPPPASMTPFCTGHQAFAFLAMFQERWFGLALNYSLKKTMWISRKLNWPVQFNCLVTWTTQSKQFQDYSCNILILSGFLWKHSLSQFPLRSNKGHLTHIEGLSFRNSP